MKSTRSLRRLTVALMLLVAFFVQGTWVLAGTTGGVSGTIKDEDGAPIAGARVTAQAPSQTVTVATDSSGHFTFLTLAPDTYTLTVTKDGYNPVSHTGVVVFADQTQTFALRMAKSLSEIAHTTSRAAGNLVKSGTTSDVYSVNAVTQQTLQGIGGGLNLNSAYSGIYSQPGVTSFIGNMGPNQVFYIRGSSYTQVGYEYDGVPVNRAFDNYNGSTLSAIGQQQLQVYTGGAPSNGTSATLGGYINQIIKTGTFPGYGSSFLGVGAPAFYHKLSIEAGGATPNRLFSWYAGFGGYNYDARVGDNSNLGGISSNGLNDQGLFGTEFSLYPAFNTGHYGNGPFSYCPNQDGTQAPSNGFAPPLLGGTVVCAPYGVQSAGFQTNLSDREAVFNVHFGIPHHNDGGRDDVQLLYDVGGTHGQWYDSINDLGGLSTFERAFNFLVPPASSGLPNTFAGHVCYLISTVGVASGFSNGQCATGGPSPFPWQDGYIYAPGTHFGAAADAATLNPYYFPGSPTNRPLFSGIPTDARSGVTNNVGIVKVQYQKNFGSNAYARIYGYSLYSDWLLNNPNEASLYYNLVGLGFGASADYPAPDYVLDTHTVGGSLELADQFNSANLVSLTANYVQANLNRFNNETWLANGLNTSSTNLADASGNCYSTVTGLIDSCYAADTAGSYGSPTDGLAETACANPSLAATPACAARASFIVTRPSGVGTTNGIVPKFTSVALQDDWRPNDKLDLTVGLRFENYTYDLVDSNTAQFNFWFNAAQHIYCYDPVTLQPILTTPTATTPPPAAPVITPYNGPCPIAPSGQPGRHPDGQNGSLLFSAISPSAFSHSLLSPRIGGTYTFNPDTVLRFSAGRYTQPTPAAQEQYLNQYGAAAAQSDFTNFFGFGYYNPAHDNPVQTSNNFDLSLEKHLKGTDYSFKVSPFYRYTTNQSVIVPLGPFFNSAVNLGVQRSEGVELQIQKGDFSRDGISGFLSYTYTYATIHYNNAPNGTNAIDVLNNNIKAFNALTRAGGGAPCYTPATPTSAGSPLASCLGVANAIANPYYGMAKQGLLDREGWFPTYENAPPAGTPDAAGPSASSPNFFTGAIQWKQHRLAIAPNFVLAEGTQYGGPTDVYGVDPRNCQANQGTTHAVPVGSPYAQDADYYTCGASLASATGFLAVPDPYNRNVFEGVGQYREPWQLNVGMQLRYDVSPKVAAVLDLANIVNSCFGGSRTAWSNTYNNNQTCLYLNNATAFTGTIPGSGFFYGASPTASANGTAAYSQVLRYPYAPSNGGLPFQAYLEFNIKM